MSPRLVQISGILVTVGFWLMGWGCATTQVAPLPTMPEAPPDYVQVPHPEGLDQGDLLAIFSEKNAPALDSFKSCDADFLTLRQKTKSKAELLEGARELVKSSPVQYHWCFYAKLFQMDGQLKSDIYIDERQKRVLDTYLFLVPIARGFYSEFGDTRYLRWAVSHYRKLSEYIFYRKLELSPQGIADLNGTMNPFGAYRMPADSTRGVLEKYGLVQPQAKPAAKPSDVSDSPSEVADPKALPSPLGADTFPAQEPEAVKSVPKVNSKPKGPVTDTSSLFDMPDEAPSENP